MKTYKCDRSYESLAELLRDNQVDAVAVCTGAPDHARHAIEVMKAGKHVWCAVPACHTLEEAQALKDTKERTGLKYMMAENYYYFNFIQEWKGIIRGEKLGRIFYAESEYVHPIRDILRDPKTGKSKNIKRID
jgi:predicted dehydrogenase